jgi:hypothetical protein
MCKLGISRLHQDGVLANKGNSEKTGKRHKARSQMMRSTPSTGKAPRNLKALSQEFISRDFEAKLANFQRENAKLL